MLGNLSLKLMATAAGGSRKSRTMSFTLNQPANRWEDAIPTGNGPLGALVFGHVAQDWVVLNHHRCWIEKRAVNCRIWLLNLQKSAAFKLKVVGPRPPPFSLCAQMR
jgi:hypothetical protein